MPSPEGLRNNQEAAKFSIGKHYLPNDIQVRIERGKLELVKPLPPVGHTAKAEASHAVLALATGTDVEEVSIIPEGESSGHTKLAHYNGIAAAAHIDEGGGGYDAMVIESQGESVSAMKSLANGIKAKKSEEIHAVAHHLETVKPTISGSEVVNVINIFDAKKKKAQTMKNKATAHIKGVDGLEHMIDDLTIVNGNVEVSSRVIDIFIKKEYNRSRKTLSSSANSDIFEAAA